MQVVVQGWQAAVFERWRPRLSCRLRCPLSHNAAVGFLARLPQEIRVRQVPWQTLPEEHTLSCTSSQMASALQEPLVPRPRGPNFAMHAELAAQGLSKWQRPRLHNCLPRPTATSASQPPAMQIMHQRTTVVQYQQRSEPISEGPLSTALVPWAQHCDRLASQVWFECCCCYLWLLVSVKPWVEIFCSQGPLRSQRKGPRNVCEMGS